MNPRAITTRVWLIMLLTAILLLPAVATSAESMDTPSPLIKLEYNNPGILVDLDVGFKGVPMPMDFDGDGDYDLLISASGSYAESGVFYFENLSGNVTMPVFRHAMQVSSSRFRLGYDGACFVVSNIDGRTHVLTPDRVRDQLVAYRDVPQNVFWDLNTIKLPEAGRYHLTNTKFTRWMLLDFDADGVHDLLCAADELLFLKNAGTDEAPNYADPVTLLNVAGQPLGQGTASTTLFADFDNDGDLDYISTRDAGFVYHENTGTRTEHAFAEGKTLMHAGQPIIMVCRATVYPAAIDWNGDGFIDIIAGDEEGKVSLLENTGRTEEGVPAFLPPRFFQQRARFVDFGALSAPRVFDWDGDGNDDIVSGNGVGEIGFIKNLGGYPPVWDAPRPLSVDGEPIRILPPGALWGYTTIDVADWDHDGLPDILVNDHDGNVRWFRNKGTRESPELEPARPVEVQWDGEPLRPEWVPVPGTAKDNELLAPWRTSPYVMDFDGDQLHDLVMLDHDGYLAVYPRYRTPDGELALAPPERSFVYPSGEAILLNQRKGSSSGRLKIAFCDWDGDGLEDLVFSSKPAVDWMRNVGRKDGKMVLEYMGRVLSRTLMGHTDGPVPADWNRDGIPDLLVGTETGVFYYWERHHFDITTTMTSTGKQLPAKYPYFKR
jgi:hypothetical protein